MHIKEIVLDGFKSYATRTVVSGFDAHFNAITGLNGSGKSNILDGICFVLGITQLNQVRVSNLQGLVYKQGQAGVTKASVSITFENSDSAQSPVGFEQCKEITVTRQVVIGGRNKYLINGHNAQASQVQNLFHSVQLNVNNPHFLIMQGRITKVLNMKPPEILGLIEEAAGTRMYETKKQAAQRKMEQKQVKVDEIERLLAEEITPKLEKLREQKQSYLKWAANNTELERLKRFCVAWDFSAKNKELEKTAGLVESLQISITEQSEQKDEHKADLEKRTAERDEHETRRKSEESGEYKALLKMEDKLSKELVKQNTKLQNHQSGIQEELEAVNLMQQQDGELQQSVIAIQEKLADAEAVLVSAIEHEQAAQDAVEAAKRGVQAATSGIAAQDTEGGGTGTLQEQLINANKTICETKVVKQQMQIKTKHLKQELKKAEKEIQAVADSNTELEDKLASKRSSKDELHARLASLGFDEARSEDLRAQRSTAQDDLRTAKETVDALWATCSRFNFDFRSPSASFDRSKVKGMVATLVNVSDPATATALEVTAGGRLYQVVVDTVHTGKLLLEKGKLQKRVTIIPLDKVSTYSISQDKLKRAAGIAHNVGGTARVALSLIGYDAQVEKAMEFVFGTTIVCDTLAAAKAVTFDRSVACKTVTLEGDVFDPRGTLSGGSRPSQGSTLLQLQKLSDQQDQVAKLEEIIDTLQTSLSECNAQEKSHMQVKRALELCEHELGLLEEQCADTDQARLVTHRDDIQRFLVEAEEAVKNANADAEQADATVKEVTYELNNMAERTERLMAEAKDALKQAKTDVKTAVKKKNAAKAKAEQLAVEVEALQEESKSNVDNLAAGEEKLKTMDEQLEGLQSKVDDLREKYTDAKESLKQKQAVLRACDEQVQALSEHMEVAETAMNVCETELERLNRKIGRVNKERSASVKHLEMLINQHEWIETEKEFFGKPHTDYDFEERDPKEANKLLHKLADNQKQLEKKINRKVMGMIEKAEKEYDDLIAKRQIIENDRTTIERVITGLDKKKNEALERTWEKVNKDFGSIFSTLLTGTKAKLEPPEGGSVLDGLVVKVAFGGKWKESLTELSGGQRSLLALSLILALLLFKPAPMYILDEVDAALDLSHTQNIGQMIRTHFAKSQFIVVSLKEGMFNNASVIYRTKFVDGVSTVRRTIGNGGRTNSNKRAGGRAGAAAEEEDSENTEAAGNRSKGKQKRAQPAASASDTAMR